jgi:large subunit ribosomal protein L29
VKAKLDKVRAQPSEDLIRRVIELKESLFRLRFKKALGDTDTVKQIRVQKKELARLKTILRARALGLGVEK